MDNKHQSNNQHETTYQPSKRDQKKFKPSAEQLHQFNQLKIRAERIISNIFSGLVESKLNSADQRSISHKVNQLYKRIQSSDFKNQGIKGLHSILVHLIRIKAGERLTSKKVLFNQVTSHAILSNQQSKALSAEIKSFNHRIIKQLSSDKDELSIQKTVAEGISSFNGLYVKWLNISRIYLLTQLRKAVKQTKRHINKLSLSLTAKRLAMQKIGLISAHVQKNVIKSAKANGHNFVRIHKAQENGINELQQLAADHSHALHMMTSFDKFVDQIRTSIVKIDSLSRDAQSYLIRRINYYQDTVLDKFKHPFTAVADHILDAERPKLLQKLLFLVAKCYYQELVDQVPDLNDSREYKLIVNFKKVSNQIHQQLIKGQLGPMNKDLFFKILKKLGRMTNVAKSVLYQARINHAINNLSLKISNHIDLSSTDKQRLYNRTVVYSKYIKQQPFTFRFAFIKRRLTAFFDRQYLYVIRRNALIQMTLLQGSIQNSHLPTKQQKAFLAQISKFWKTSQLTSFRKADLNQVEAQSLVEDHRQNLKQLTTLCKIVRKRINTAEVLQLLHQKASFIINEIMNAGSITQADNIEQQGENWFYRDLLYKHSKASHSRKQIVFSQNRTFHNEINLAILQPDLRKIVNDCVDHYINVYGDKMLQKQGIAQSKARWMTQLTHEVKQNLTPLFLRIKHEYVVRTDNLIHDLYYQLMAYSSSQDVIKHFEKIRLQLLKKIRQAKRFMRLEFTRQSGLHDMYIFVNKVMGTSDNKRLKFNQRINEMLKTAQQQINDTPVKSNEVKSAFVNRMLRAVNQSSSRANCKSDSDLNNILQNSRYQLIQILQQVHLYGWSKVVSHAEHLMTNNLDSVSKQAKQSCFNLLKDTDSDIREQIKQGYVDKLTDIFCSGHNKLRQIVKHSIYLNPTKRSIYQKLNLAVRKTRGYINKFAKSKMKTKYSKRLNVIRKDVDHRLSIVNDSHKLSSVSQTNYKKIVSLGLEIVRKSQLNKFNKYSSKVDDMIKKLKLLNNHESRIIGREFNRSYHKFIYQISHASDVNSYLSHEQKGAKALSKVLAHGKVLNAKKIKYLHAIEIKINYAKRRIQKLNNLNGSDKKASDHLLDEIKQRSIHTLGNAPDKKHLLSIEKGGKKMVSQILNKISSANVLVSAIRSADNQISKSSLNNSQKRNMLNKIRKVIGSEVDDDHKDHKQSFHKKNDRSKKGKREIKIIKTKNRH